MKSIDLKERSNRIEENSNLNLENITKDITLSKNKDDINFNS